MLRYIALVLMLVDVQDRAVLCIEEPENGIHPSRVPNLAELLRDYAVEASDAVGADNPLRQVVLNSHSPEVARQFSCDDLIFVERALTSADGPSQRFQADRRHVADDPVERNGVGGYCRQPRKRSPISSAVRPVSSRIQATESGVWIRYVSRQLAYAVVADGGTDRLLVPIIQWAVQPAGPRRGDPRTGVQEAKRQRIRLPGCLQNRGDADLRPPRFRGLHARRAPEGVPTRWIDRMWSRSSPFGCRNPGSCSTVPPSPKAASTPTAQVPVPSITEIEHIPDPKGRLDQLLLHAAGRPSGRRGRIFRRSIVNRRVSVAEYIADFSPLRERAGISTIPGSAGRALSVQEPPRLTAPANPHTPMPTKRAILSELTRGELRGNLDYYGLDVHDRRVKSQLVDALAASRKARLDEMLLGLYRDRLKELCRAFGLDDSGRKKADLVERLLGPAAASKNADGATRAATSAPAVDTADPPAETLGVEQLERYLWSAADILRGSIDSSDYKTYIFGLLFLKRLSDRFKEEAEKLVADGVSEDVAWAAPDEHQFFVPDRARWGVIQKRATNIGTALNTACAKLEEQNPAIEGVLAGIDYNDERKLGDAKNRDTVLARLVQHFSQVSLRNDRMAEPDLLGRAYEYVIEQFADDAGKKGGEFYTPRMVVRLIVELLAPTERMRICDPTAGSGGMLIECAHHIERQGGNPAQPDPPRSGEEPRHVGHLQDEHAAPRPARRPHREGRHHPRPEAGRGRRAAGWLPRNTDIANGQLARRQSES